MSTLYITEYADPPSDGNGNPIPVGKEPALARQTVGVSGTSAASSALNIGTRFVRLHCDGIFSYRIGTGTPTALTTDGRVTAGTTEFVGIDQAIASNTLKIAAITNT